MPERPDVRYAWNDDVALAYQVFGNGSVALIYLQGYCSHVDLNWASAYLARFLRGLGAHARVVMTDRRGWGCSDRFSPGDVAPLEVQVDDLVAVMDAADTERAVIFGSWETTLTAMLFAAGRPERTASIVLCDPFVSYLATPETPWMWSQRDWSSINDLVRKAWGTPFYRPEDFGDRREFLQWFVPWSRASVAPGALAAESDHFSAIDARGVLSLIQAPTLMISGVDEMIRRNAAFLADKIVGARLLEPVAKDETGWFHWYERGPEVLEAVAALIGQVQEEERSFARVLATVLFTDIVGSTQHAAEVGDRAWTQILERHHSIVRASIARFRGEEVDTAGDGFFVTFDGPARAVHAARAIVDGVRALGIDVRVGVHTGEVETIGEKIGGMGVVIGARIGALAGPGEVFVSSTVKELTAGSGLLLEDAGEHVLKGVPEPWRLYRAVGA